MFFFLRNRACSVALDPVYREIWLHIQGET